VAIMLDAGGLIAIDNNDRRVGALLRIANRERIPVRTSAVVVAQAWRDGARQANLARPLAGTNIVSVAQPSAAASANCWREPEPLVLSTGMLRCSRIRATS
jgi:hypothetical protein